MADLGFNQPGGMSRVAEFNNGMRISVDEASWSFGMELHFEAGRNAIQCSIQPLLTCPRAD